MPLKQNDHLVDALRYALHSTLGRVHNTDTYLSNIQRRLVTHDAGEQQE